MTRDLVKSNNKKIKKALKAIDELEISFDMIFHDKDRDHIQVGYDIQKIKKILMTDKEKADKVKLEAIKKILIELEEASGIVPGTKQITGWKSLFASTRWNKLSNNEQLKRIGKHIDGTVLEHNEKINKILEG